MLVDGLTHILQHELNDVPRIEVVNALERLCADAKQKASIPQSDHAQKNGESLLTNPLSVQQVTQELMSGLKFYVGLLNQRLLGGPNKLLM